LIADAEFLGDALGSGNASDESLSGKSQRGAGQSCSSREFRHDVSLWSQPLSVNEMSRSRNPD
jgi:hypothetical protein